MNFLLFDFSDFLCDAWLQTILKTQVNNQIVNYPRMQIKLLHMGKGKKLLHINQEKNLTF